MGILLRGQKSGDDGEDEIRGSHGPRQEAELLHGAVQITLAEPPAASHRHQRLLFIPVSFGRQKGLKATKMIAVKEAPFSSLDLS